MTDLPKWIRWSKAKGRYILLGVKKDKNEL